MIVIDDKSYEKISDAPDLGSWVGHYDDLGKNHKRSYYGLSADAGKLPTVADHPEYKDLKTGSTAYCVDTGALYMYESSTDQWYQQ